VTVNGFLVGLKNEIAVLLSQFGLTITGVFSRYPECYPATYTQKFSVGMRL